MDCENHVIPPLVVFTIFDESPTAQPVVADINDTDFNVRSIPEF